MPMSSRDMGLLRVRWLVLALALACTGPAPGAEKGNAPTALPDLPAGKETRVESPRVGGGFFLVYVPSDYKPDRRWPVVFCYHGQNGQPTVWPIKDVTGGKGFVIFGMGYFPEHSKAMTIPELDRYCSREVDSALAAFAAVEGRLKMDKEQVIVSGFSMGGWFAGMFGEISPSTWAGVAILGAGRRKFDAPLRPAGILRRKPIYIGAGDKDPNFPSAQRPGRP
jgi:poly(3-hydroxybutyrate) depolymerase